MRYHLTIVRMAISKEKRKRRRKKRREKNRKKKTSVGEDVDKLEPCTLLAEMQNGASTMENSMGIPPQI